MSQNLQITSPLHNQGDSFSLDPCQYQQQESEPQSFGSCYVTTPSKTNKKRKERPAGTQQRAPQQLNQSGSNTSIMKQVMRKDIELEQLRDYSAQLTEKVNDLEFLLNKAAEEVRKKNEDYQQQELELAQLRLELHEVEMGRNMELSSSPQFQEVWNHGAYVEQENGQLRERVQELEYDVNSKSSSIQQAHEVIENLQMEMQRLDEELKGRTRKLKKLRMKYKEMKTKCKQTCEVDKELESLRRENENIKEDMKQMLKDKIEQERKERKSKGINELELINKQLEAKVKAFEEQLLKTVQSRDQDFQYSTFNRELNNVEQELKLCHEQIRKQELFKQQNEEDQMMNMQLIDELQSKNDQLQKSLDELRIQNRILQKTVSDNMITSNSLKHDLTYSRSIKQVPDLNLRSSQEDQDLFLIDDRSKVQSSRLQTQRNAGIKRSQLHVTLNHNNRSQLDLSQTTEQTDPIKEWVYSLPNLQLQEELLKSLDREQVTKSKIQEWLQIATVKLQNKLKHSLEMTQQLINSQEELTSYVTQLHDQLWVHQNQNTVLKEMLHQSCNQSSYIKQFIQISNSSSSVQTLDTNPFQFDQLQHLLIQINSITSIAQSWKSNQQLQLKNHLHQSNQELQQSKLQILEKQTQILQQVESQLEYKNQEISKLQAAHQLEKQDIYKAWEKENQDNAKAVTITIEQLKTENINLKKHQQSHKENNHLDRTPLSNKNSLTQRVQTELLSSYQSSIHYKGGDAHDMVTHYKNKAKQSYEKKVQELETLLRYISEAANGYDFEKNQFRFQPNKMNSQNYILKQTTEKMQSKNPTVIKFVKDIQYTIDGLYQEILEIKIHLISFLNQAVVHVISQDPHGTEDIIKTNPQVQNSLNWLLETAKPDYMHIQDTKILLENSNQLWNSFVFKSAPFNLESSPQRQNYSEISCFRQTYLSSPSQINDSLTQHNPLTTECAVPELQYILDIQMKVVYNLLQALNTLCIQDNKDSASSLQQVNSEVPLLIGGCSLITSIRPSLDVSNQVIKSLIPRFYSMPKEDPQQKLDSFVQGAVKYLQELNKTLNELPANFFNSLTLQHNSTSLTIQDFANSIQKQFTLPQMSPENESAIIQEFIEQLKRNLSKY